ncbi:MAG: transporter [Pseudolabrys sp.]|nr:transporter [Pseudolabrys sp.]
MHNAAMGLTSLKGTAALGLAFAALCAPAFAVEGGQSPYLKGFRDFLTGVLPPPGLQLRQDVYFYSGRENTRIPQGQLDVRLRNRISILSATVITPYRILGGHYAFAARLAGTDTEVDRTVTRPLTTVAAHGDLAALNDVVLTPVMIGWHAGHFHWNVSATVWLPAGNYDSNRLANTGKNTVAVSPQLGVTYFNPATGWEMSGAAIYVTSLENSATRYQSGDLLHFDFAIGRQLTRSFKLGVVGYAMEQIGADSGAGATLGARKARVLGLGPALAFTFPVNNVPLTLVAKYYREFNAQNTTQGDAGSLSARVRF